VVPLESALALVVEQQNPNGVSRVDENSKIHTKSEQNGKSYSRSTAKASRVAVVDVRRIDEVDSPKGGARRVSEIMAGADVHQDVKVDGCVAEAHRAGEGSSKDKDIFRCLMAL
jgi:hypothetical protein